MNRPTIGVQSKNIISDDYPIEGFEMLKRAGFNCCDFSLNSYLSNEMLYQYRRNDFFDKPGGRRAHQPDAYAVSGLCAGCA